MSYHVEYNPELKIRYPFQRKKKRISIIPIVILGCLAVVLMTKAHVLRFLIPGDPDITTTAFNGMVERIEKGIPIGDSLVAFCEEIIENASE